MESDSGGVNRGKDVVTALEKMRNRNTHSLQSLAMLVSLVAEISIAYPPWVQKASFIAHNTLSRICPEVACQWPLPRVAFVIHKNYHINVHEFRRIAMLPQRSPGWHLARSGSVDVENDIVRGPLVSSSVVPMILGHKSGYIKDHSKVMEKQVHVTQEEIRPDGALRMQRGTACEPMIMANVKVIMQAMARASFSSSSMVSIKEVGLQVCMNYPFMAASPDGIIDICDPDTQNHYRGGLEMKCRGDADALPPKIIPEDYYDQCQHTCAVLGLKEYTFVFYSMNLVSIEFFRFDSQAWDRHFVAVQNYYWSKLWPAILLKALGKLAPAPDLLPPCSLMSAPIISWICDGTGLTVDDLFTMENDPLAYDLLHRENERLLHPPPQSNLSVSLICANLVHNMPYQ